MLRDTINKMTTDIYARVDEHGQKDPIIDTTRDFATILAEAVFAGNALLSINGYSPYNAVYGRLPDILPDLNCIDLPVEPGASNMPGTIANTHKLRETAIEAIVSASAKARLNRAMEQRRTPTAGEELNLKPGDLIDFYREAPNKSTSGWWGPATVVDTSQIHTDASFLFVLPPELRRQHESAMFENISPTSLASAG